MNKTLDMEVNDRYIFTLEFVEEIAVFLKSGVGKDLIINIVLCLLMFLPGVAHALWLVTR